MQHLDCEDEYEVWKTKKITDTENNVKTKVKDLKQYLDDTKNEIYSKFSMKDEELIPALVYRLTHMSEFNDKEKEEQLEMQKNRSEYDRKRAMIGRLTGRQLFERDKSLVTSDTKYDASFEPSEEDLQK